MITPSSRFGIVCVLNLLSSICPPPENIERLLPNPSPILLLIVFRIDNGVRVLPTLRYGEGASPCACAGNCRELSFTLNCRRRSPLSFFTRFQFLSTPSGTRPRRSEKTIQKRLPAAVSYTERLAAYVGCPSAHTVLVRSDAIRPTRPNPPDPRARHSVSD